MNLRQLLHKLLHITATTLFLHDKNTPVRDAVMDFGAKRFDFIRSWLSTIESRLVTTGLVGTKLAWFPRRELKRSQLG